MSDQVINESFETALNLINDLNINMNDLYNYFKNKNVVKFPKKNEVKKCWGDYDSDDEMEYYNNEPKKTIVVEEIIIKEEVVIKEEEIAFEEVKRNKNRNRNRNINCITIHNLQEFLDFMRLTPKKEYYIKPEAHCFHTYNGTLCPDVKKCKKIHIQRCINGNSCNKKKCTYIHSFDMPTDEAENNFINTMDQYNLIKSKKRVFH